MPKLEPKVIQKELEEGHLWPVYWIYGGEPMKMRELTKRIRKAALGEATASTAGASTLSLSEEQLDGSDCDAAQILDAAQSLTLGGGLRFIRVRGGHEVKELELIEPLLTGRTKRDQLSSVVVFWSKDLDQRKKSSKMLVEKTAVVACEEVAEAERESWIEYLSKIRGLKLDAALVTQLRSLDPWSLDIIDQELEKLSLSKDVSGDVLLAGGVTGSTSDRFIQALLSKNKKEALVVLEHFANEPEEALPLLGLLAWNVRQLAAQTSKTGTTKMNPFLADKIRRWTPHWNSEQLDQLQERLVDLDFHSKQTAHLSLGLWTELVLYSCK